MKREHEVKEFYDKVALDYEKEHQDRYLDRILEHFVLNNIPPGENLKILDLGAGIGRFARPLLNLNHEVVLVEISKKN